MSEDQPGCLILNPLPPLPGPRSRKRHGHRRPPPRSDEDKRNAIYRFPPHGKVGLVCQAGSVQNCDERNRLDCKNGISVKWLITQKHQASSNIHVYHYGLKSILKLNTFTKDYRGRYECGLFCDNHDRPVAVQSLQIDSIENGHYSDLRIILGSLIPIFLLLFLTVLVVLCKRYRWYKKWRRRIRQRRNETENTIENSTAMTIQGGRPPEATPGEPLGNPCESGALFLDHFPCIRLPTYEESVDDPSAQSTGEPPPYQETDDGDTDTRTNTPEGRDTGVFFIQVTEENTPIVGHEETQVETELAYRSTSEL